MKNKKPKAVIISLGGTPNPIVFSLNRQRPEYICFFVSKGTRESIRRDVLPKLNFNFMHYDWITTDNPESLSSCYRAVNSKLAEILEKWEVDARNLVVDYTGGTKTMSVALSLATIENCSTYAYIGGVERTKQGKGIVIDGKEKMYYLENPWDEMAVSERKEAAILFNKARYLSASEVFIKVAEKVSRTNKAFFKAMANLSAGYAFWDRFDHRRARDKIYSAVDILNVQAAASGTEEINSLVENVNTNLSFLLKLNNDEHQKGRMFCYDLLSNAKRRADLENKYDDAVARLYRALEAIAQDELKSRYDINTSNVRIEQIPGHLRQYYKRYYDEKSNKTIIPLYASYLLLDGLKNSLGSKFLSMYQKEIKPILNIRNRSILAHGFTSVKEETFDKMFSLTMSFAEIREDQLPRFPELKF